MKKVIIIYSTAGMGHKKAAMALLKSFQERVKDTVEVKAIDLLEYSSGLYRFLYTTFYIFLISRTKWLWGAMYYFTNNPFVDAAIRKMRDATDARNLKKLEGMLLEESPDAIVATHFLLPGISGSLRSHKAFRSRIYAVVTDYGPHSYWLSPYVDRYFVGSDSASLEMEKRGIPPEKLTVTGIPTMKEFSGEFNTQEVQKTYGLDSQRKTIFLLSGGFGVGPMGKILVSLNSCRSEIQVIAVCGHNETVFRNLQILKDQLDYPLILIGYTDKIAELMSVSDLMVTKAGGISVTEALNARLPMILFASVPGQETWNEQLLVGGGASEKAASVDDIPVMADRILLSQDACERLKAGIEKIRRPDAAKEIVDIVSSEI
ncbi:MAG: glycosyltransferase [Candidatus Omnitrophota bacterium]